MIEIKGNLFEQVCDCIAIPTNGMIKANGRAVMGAGVAKEAVRRFPDIDLALGNLLQLRGNKVYRLVPGPTRISPYNVVSFPTKHDWRDDSDLSLINKSVQELVAMTDERRWKRVCLPRVGAGLGKLPWSAVKSLLETCLDDRFTIVSL